MRPTSPFNVLWNALRNIWEQVTPFDCSVWSCREFHDLEHLPVEIRASVCDSYPRNHNFSAEPGQLIPRRKLATRLAHFRQFYPEKMRNLVDLSCSKGFFVFDAASQSTCERALGIDMCDATLKTCEHLKQCFNHPERVRFEKQTIAELAERIEEFGGPFETVLLVNTYQYLFFGSSIAPALSRDHCEIFRQIRRICSGRVIFHNRISYERVQTHIREAVKGEDLARYYTPEAIKSAASEFFRVTETPVWGGHPVWLLDAI